MVYYAKSLKKTSVKIALWYVTEILVLVQSRVNIYLKLTNLGVLKIDYFKFLSLTFDFSPKAKQSVNIIF